MRHETVRYITIITDLLLINLAFVLAYLARYDWQWLRPVIYQEPYRRLFWPAASAALPAYTYF